MTGAWPSFAASSSIAQFVHQNGWRRATARLQLGRGLVLRVNGLGDIATSSEHFIVRSIASSALQEIEGFVQ